ncbi:9843_t:CDS:2, partial [Paraglomus brasilianum]
MAEAVFAHMLRQNGLEDQFHVDSAGTSSYHILGQLKHVVNTGFQWITVVDKIKPEGSKAIVQLFGDFDPEGDRIISDPYYG